MEEDLRAYLLTLSAITDLIGQRVYFIKLPQDTTFPALTINRISTQRRRSHGGNSNLTRPRIQLTCFAETYLATKAISTQIVNALESYVGTMGSTQVYDSFVENELDLYDSESKIYYLPIDVMIRYNG